MLRFFTSFIGVIFTVATLGLILGCALVAGIFLAYGSDLPDHESLASYEPATISRVYSGDGNVMDEFAQERRLFTPIEEIPDVVKNAFISAEDKNFYEHSGFDMVGIISAGVDFAKGGRLRGASTIPQQVAKNFLLDGSVTAERKIKEIILATRMVSTLGKDKILELYLNEIDLGVRSFGVTAAADSYFGKRLEDLTIEEAAFLAVHPKAPYDYNPAKDYDKAFERRNFILREMRENGYISEVEYEIATAEPIRSVQTGEYRTARAKRPPRNYFTDEIRRQLSAQFGEEQFFTGGMTVRATMDPELQVAAQNSLRAGLERYDRAASPYRGPVTTIDPEILENESAWRAALEATEAPRDINGWYPAVVLEVGDKTARIGIDTVENDADGHFLSYARERKWAVNRLFEDGTRKKMTSVKDMFDVGDVVMVKQVEGNWTLRQIPLVQGGFVAMDVNTGRVLAMQGGFSYQHSVFNRATQAQRQPGSVFKPFVYAAALDSGYSPVSIIVDAPIEINTPQGLWRPKNASNKFYGPAPLRVGIEQSRNLMTIRLAEDVGMGVVGGYAERFGVYKNMLRQLSGALGAQESTLYKVVSAYAMFANGGERVEPTLVDRVQDRYGKTVFRHDRRACENCKTASLDDGRGPRIQSNRARVMDPVTAYNITSFMEGVVDRGTAAKTVNLGVPVAGKTGTTNDSKDVWFVGFTNNIVAGCYIGFDNPKSLGKKASGGGMCGPVFNQFMRQAIKKYGAGEFEVPGDTVFYKFDRFTGARLPNDAVGDHVVRELFRIGEEPLVGGLQTIIDGGFEASTNIEIFSSFLRTTAPAKKDKVVKTSTGKKVKLAPKASFGSLSSGGRY